VKIAKDAGDAKKEEEEIKRKIPMTRDLMFIFTPHRHTICARTSGIYL
jgi:hypothetical protein